jgi:hypothetical protein
VVLAVDVFGHHDLTVGFQPFLNNTENKIIFKLMVKLF